VCNLFPLGLLAISFGYAEFSIFEKEHITMLIKPHTYTYSNLSMERLTTFVNGVFYLLAFVVAFEIFVSEIFCSWEDLIFLDKAKKAEFFVFGREYFLYNSFTV